MSFLTQIKDEILETRLSRPPLRLAQAHGLFAYGRRFDPEEVSLRTEHPGVAALYQKLLRVHAGKRAEIAVQCRQGRGRELFLIQLPRREDREALLARLEKPPLDSPELAAACLSGAFLACGNATDPQKAYRLEFVVREAEPAAALRALLEGLVPGASLSSRRGAGVVYYKECAAIEDLLTLLGASGCALAMIDVEIVKGVRNQAMRVTNCETANIDKTVRAASGQIADIELVLSRLGLPALPEPLQEAALVRLENPELSLRELADAFPQPISRSGVHHRLRKLGELADKIRREQGEADHA